MHSPAAVTHSERATPDRRQAAGKKGETSESEPLLAPLDLAGRTITFDTPRTRHAHAWFLVEEKKAESIAIVKDNRSEPHGFLKAHPDHGFDLVQPGR